MPATVRWNCPSDVGYACSTSLGSNNPPFFGLPTRVPPCLIQAYDVRVAIQSMFYHVPAAACLLAVIILAQLLLKDTVIMEVRDQLQRRSTCAGAVVFDPVRQFTIKTITNTTRCQLAFGAEEIDMLHERGTASLRAKLVKDVSLGMSMFALLALMCFWLRDPLHISFVTLGIVIFILWSAIKLAHLQRNSAVLSQLQFSKLARPRARHSVERKLIVADKIFNKCTAGSRKWGVLSKISSL